MILVRSIIQGAWVFSCISASSNSIISVFIQKKNSENIYFNYRARTRGNTWKTVENVLYNGAEGEIRKLYKSDSSCNICPCIRTR